jgi:ABC-type polysaccharide/polyol phosphate transport system ATPase subunit
MSAIFRLHNVSVKFEKHSAAQRSLRHLVARKLNGRNDDVFHALTNVSLRITEGEHIGVIGRNGAGKSTLLRVLTRVIEPQEGEVYLNSYKRIVPLLELGIGFQPDLTGRENCRLVGYLMGYTNGEIETKLPAIHHFAEIGEFFDEPVKTYSSGMFARLAFALATDVEPEVLVVDEVFGVGDEFFMRKCIVRMQQLMRRGTTTIFVSHNVDFLVRQCTRLLWMDGGVIVMDGEPARVAEAYRSHAGNAEEILNRQQRNELVNE